MPVQTIPRPDDFPWRMFTESAAQTRDLGDRAARQLQGGEVLLLFGPLGAGKTCFVQGLCRGLDIAEPVTSPTFTLVHRYVGRLVVHHLDCFRIGLHDDLTEIGVEAVLEEVDRQRAVLVAEWPQPLLPLLPARLEWLALPGKRPQERIWHLRGLPDLPSLWGDVFRNESGSC